MRISESCARCLYDRQLNRTDNAEYLAEIRALLDNRSENDTSPYMVYLFNRIYVNTMALVRITGVSRRSIMIWFLVWRMSFGAR